MSAAGRVVAVGDVGLAARDLEGLARFYREMLGFRQSVYIAGVVAIFEVGDTDVFLAPGGPAAAEFDLAADDVDARQRKLVAAGVACDELRDDKRTGHRSFGFTDPDGNRVRVLRAHPRARGRS